jgi:hypothetical protein
VRKLYSFLMTTLDGFYEGPSQEFHFWNVDQEFNEFSIGQLHDTDILLLGRVTYEGMASYWPTQAARDDDPVALGEGKSLFRSSRQELGLKLLQTRTFRSGNVLLTYRPPRRAR